MTPRRNTLPAASGLLIGCSLAAGAALAANTYNCTTLDIPGGGPTQLWRLNNMGFIAGNSSNGAFVYNPVTGVWVQLPAPPAASGYGPADLAIFDINDNGVMVGTAQNNAVNNGAEQGFILLSLTDATTYSFFPHTDPANEGNNNTEFRGINNNRLIVGWSINSAAFTGQGTVNGGAFVFNPTAAAIGSFAPGFTTFDPTLSDDSTANLTLLSGINSAIVMAGSSRSASIAREGILAGPNSLAFREVPNAAFAVALRGINDLDPFSSGNCDNGSCVRVAGWGQNFGNGNFVSFYLDYDPVSGFVQAPQTIDCSAQIPASANTLTIQGVNNSDAVTGQYTDALNKPHGVVGFVATTVPAQTCAASAGGCDLSNGDIPHSVTGGPNPLPGTVMESTCKVAQDPRIVQFGSCTGHTLPVAQVCPGFGTTVIPDYLCGGSGPSNSGFVLADTVAEGVDALSGILVDSEAHADVALGTAPACPVTVGAWAPRSGSAVEGTIPEGDLLIENTGGCGSSKIVSRGLSIYGIGLTLNTDALPGGTLRQKLQEFTQAKYTNLLTTIAEGNMTAQERSTVTACVTRSQSFFARGKDGCAARIAVSCDKQVASNPGNFSGSPTDPNVFGDIQGRLASIFFTLNTRILGNPPNSTWPPANLPSCGED